MKEDHETTDMHNVLKSLMSIKGKRSEVEQVIKNHKACAKVYTKLLLLKKDFKVAQKFVKESNQDPG